MNSAAKYGAGIAFIGFALFTLNWFIETSIAAGTIVGAGSVVVEELPPD